LTLQQPKAEHYHYRDIKNICGACVMQAPLVQLGGAKYKRNFDHGVGHLIEGTMMMNIANNGLIKGNHSNKEHFVYSSK
jgi:hypothetical protein